MFIADAAKAAGVLPATLRYYERIGLLPGVSRRTSGYREYSADDVRLVRFIRRAQSLGLSLDDARQLAALRKLRPSQRNAVRRIAAARLVDISRRIADLTRMKRALEALVASCGEGGTPACPILEALESQGEPS
jgi:MerR family copper efflux transcriptional regulator